MPPKKKPEKKKEEDEEPAGYNTAIMNRDQLMQYARLLEKEIENMRKHCNFYQKVEDELVELLRVSEDHLRDTEDSILLKDVELEKMNLQVLNHLKEKRQWPKYMEYASDVKMDKLSNETCDLLGQEEERHLQETGRLKQTLQEKDRKLEALRVKIEMARRENLEKNEACLKETDHRQKSLLEQGVRKFNDVIEDIKMDFRKAKETLEYEAREGKMMSERAFNKACDASKQKLHNYYKEVTRQDLDSIKRLKQEIQRVEDKIKSSKVLLQEAQKENRELNEIKHYRLAKKSSSKTFTKYHPSPAALMEALRRHKDMEKLAIENKELEEQIENVTEQTYNLRRQFTLALNKARDSAEMKASFLERKLNFIRDGTRNESLTSIVGNESVNAEDNDESEIESSSNSEGNK